MMLSRGLPFSLLLHAIVLTVVVMFGNHVVRHPVRPPHSINVSMVHLPPAQVRETQKAPEPAVIPEPQQEIKPELPPKEVPKPKPVEKTPEKVKPQPKVEVPEPQASKPAADLDEPSEALSQPVVNGPSASDTDSDFPFAWYLSRVEGLIARNWDPRQINFGPRAVVSCAVHFTISRNGTVSQVTLVRNSGVGVFDRESLRAVQTTKLPPLPPQFTGPSLGVTFIFNQKSGT